MKEVANEIRHWLESAVMDCAASCEENSDKMYNNVGVLTDLLGDKIFDQVMMLGYKFSDKQFVITYNAILNELSKNAHQPLKRACKKLRKT